MQNKFKNWQRLKWEIQKKFRRPKFLKSRQIWWAYLGQNIGTEINGKSNLFLRPVLILNVVYQNACIIIPLSSKEKTGSYYYNFIDSEEVEQTALLTQIRYIDPKRLRYKSSQINKQEFVKIKNKLTQIINKPI